MGCPTCKTRLGRQRTSGGYVHTCRRCEGRLVTLPVLRKIGAPHGFLANMWQQSRRPGVPRRRSCPLCERRMAQVESDVAGRPLTLDVCSACPGIWFDPAEFESIPRAPILPAKAEKDFAPEAREQLALLRLETVKRQQEAADSGDTTPDQAWHWLPGLLGLPVELDAPQVARLPWITWSAIVACIATTLLVVFGGPEPFRDAVYGEWGLIPADWTRHGGLTLVTSFFLHAGLWHLLGNMYFLFMFGDNVEDGLGRMGYAWLLVAGHVVGMLLHTLFAPGDHVPCVGASAGISAVIACYAVVFPQVRLGFMFRYFLYFQWFRMSAVWALVIYTGLQLVGAYAQIQGFGGVSYLGHLGGLVVGLIGGFLYRDLQARRTARDFGSQSSVG